MTDLSTAEQRARAARRGPPRAPDTVRVLGEVTPVIGDEDGRTSQERWNAMTPSQRHGYVMRLERAVLDMGKEIGTSREQLRGAVEALQRIASDDCMIVRDETGGWIDTGAPQRIAQDALDALGDQ